MIAQVPHECTSVNCRHKEETLVYKMIFIDDKAYPVCEDCYKLLGQVSQLILNYD